MEIQDDGSGMSEAVLKKVLDPFYTTKKSASIRSGTPHALPGGGKSGWTLYHRLPGG